MQTWGKRVGSYLWKENKVNVFESSCTPQPQTQWLSSYYKSQTTALLITWLQVEAAEKPSIASVPLLCFYGVQGMSGQWSWELNYFWFALLSLSLSTIRPMFSSLSQLPLTLPHFLYVVLCRPFPSHAMVSLTNAWSACVWY